ncbi:hypothetical protein BQ8420_02920 [Nocardiopsis sp. JB363]|nr:hypothetical protein BQ8420_02920 [Nocardiopsis sp. JB363]
MRLSAPHATLDPVLSDRQCPVCGDWYDPSDPGPSHPHNNH